MTERDLFIIALQQPGPAQRAAYLDRACGDDPALRGRVEELLREQEQLGSFLERPAQGPGCTGPFTPASGEEITIAPAEGPGAVIGPYKLLQPIGEGGMGAVFMAEQTQPVQRKVALKLIKPGMDSRPIVVRFEAERQALALMDHPNIAKVFDAGTTDGGRPFFVMELVKGVPLTQYCDEHKLTLKQRLELFIPVCQAVQHAHQKGIIHRDLKPSNVLAALYDGRPVPKVIDFGVAKATGQKLTERTLFTEFGSVVGTLEYMSPEQAELNQLDIDTRSDVYSLGVMLYELLTGTTPLERSRTKETGLLELLRIIREEEPPRPSVRLSTSEELPAIAASRGLEPKKLSGVVRGDLDWIVMKALEKDRDRRYESANGFALDIGRYLADEPVAACPPSSWYRVRKFVRRNRARLTVAACLVLGGMAVGGSAGWAAWDRGLREAKLEREEGVRRADAAFRVRESLNAARALNAENKVAAARQKLAEAQSQLGQDRPALSGLAAEIDALEVALNRLEQFQDLIDRANEAETTSTAELALEADGSPAIAGRPLQSSNWERQPARAVPFLLQTLALYAVLDREDWTTDLDANLLSKDEVDQVRRSAYEALMWLGDDMLRRQEEHASGQKLSPESAARQALFYLAKAETAHEPTKAFLTLRAECRTIVGEKEAARADRRLADETAPTLALDDYLLGRAAYDAGDKAVAIQAFEAALRREPTHYWSLMRLGYCLCDFGQGREDFAMAAGIFSGCILKRSDHAHAYYCRGQAYIRLGCYEEAVADYSRAIELDPKDAATWSSRGIAYGSQGQPAKAVADLSRAIELDPKDAKAWNDRGHAYNNLGQPAKAVADYSRAVELDPKYAKAWYDRGVAYAELGQLDKAVADCSKAIELDPTDAAAWTNRGVAYGAMGQPAKAVADCSKAIELDPKLAKAWYNRGEAYLALGQPDKVVADCSKAIELDPKYTKAWYDRGIAYLALGQPAKAVADCSRAIELDPKDAKPWYDRGAAYLALGQPAKAVADCSRAIELNPKNANAWNNRGFAYDGLGQPAKAVADLSRAIALDPKLANAWNNRGLVYLLALDQPAKAIADFSQAIELDPKGAAPWTNRANAYLNLGQLDKAVADCSKAIALNPDYAEAHCTLGLVLQRQGAFPTALTELRRGHELGSKNPRWSHPSAQWVRRCERLIELDGQLPGFLEGKTTPASADERIELAELCSFKRLYRDAIRFYEEAFAGPPEAAAKLLAARRYDAARAAALAGCGRGEDAANPDERERLRSLAFVWLRDELTRWTKQLENNPTALERMLRHWQADADLAGVREADPLAELPQTEQEKWRRLWAEVAATLERTHGARQPKAKP